MRQRFPGTILIDFSDLECHAMHVACMAPHNAGLVAEVQKSLPLFYADAYHGGLFRGCFYGMQFYREPVPGFFALLRRISENEIRNFASASERFADCGWTSSPQEYWGSLSSTVRKLSVASAAAKRGLH